MKEQHQVAIVVKKSRALNYNSIKNRGNFHHMWIVWWSGDFFLFWSVLLFVFVIRANDDDGFRVFFLISFGIIFFSWQLDSCIVIFPLFLLLRVLSIFFVFFCLVNFSSIFQLTCFFLLLDCNSFLFTMKFATILIEERILSLCANFD